MKKSISIFLVCLMSIYLFGCFKTIPDGEHQEEYEDILSIISEEYGDYISPKISEYDDQVVISLNVREEYFTNEDMRNNMPAYKIIENSRLKVNNYLKENTDCRLSKQLKDKIGFLRMKTVKEYLGASQAIVFFEVKTDFRDTTKFFVIYDEIDVDWLDEMCSITREDNDYNEYVENMYDYISQTGDDITRIAILEKKGLEESEQDKWREEVKSKFPLMTE
ncbi:MAG: hypothetical protein K6G47_00195 [Clostridia bacterium]|nr:hypothetical protein [Clostridia bacterium]